MKKFHIALGVSSIEESVRDYMAGNHLSTPILRDMSVFPFQVQKNNYCLTLRVVV